MSSRARIPVVLCNAEPHSQSLPEEPKSVYKLQKISRSIHSFTNPILLLDPNITFLSGSPQTSLLTLAVLTPVCPCIAAHSVFRLSKAAQYNYSPLASVTSSVTSAALGRHVATRVLRPPRKFGCSIVFLIKWTPCKWTPWRLLKTKLLRPPRRMLLPRTPPQRKLPPWRPVSVVPFSVV
jgi:hypothetical protein